MLNENESHVFCLQMSSVLVGYTDAAANAAQAASLINNSKYRAYVAAVDKALKAFEATNEWADLISALAKLSRVSQIVTLFFLLLQSLLHASS